MKIVALLCGLLASAFAWVAGVYITDVGVQFLDLWPDTISQQFLGLVTWHAIVAAAIVGGILAVLSPISGTLLLLAVAAGWAWLALTLPVGFTWQMIAPIALCVLGALAAIGAMFRGRARRLSERDGPTAEDIEREEALRFEPSEEAQALFTERTVPEPPVTNIVPVPVPTQRRADDYPPHGLSGAMAANVAILLVLAGAVGLLAYSEFRSGDLMAAFAPSGPRAAMVSEGAPSLAPPVPAAEAPATPVGEPAAAASEQAEDAPAEAPAMAAIDVGSGPVAAGEDGPWSNPFSYCTSVGTVDFPDHRYDGPFLVAEIADALRVPDSSSPDRVRWRCYEGAVLACAAFDGPICAMTPTVAEMVEFCAQNPGTDGLLAPNGSWSCDGTQPVIPDGENWPVDARGFLPGAWQAVAQPSDP